MTTDRRVIDCAECDPAGPTCERCVAMLVDDERAIDMLNSGSRPNHDLYSAAIGLKLLAKLGARSLCSCVALDDAYPGVTIGKNAIDGWCIVKPHAELLRRLGWSAADTVRVDEPLLMVYTR
jgi:hypothetical protein